MNDAFAAAQHLKQIHPNSCVSWALEMVLVMRGVPNVQAGHFQNQNKGKGFEPAYLAELGGFGIKSQIISFGDDWMLFANKMAEEINKGFCPIVTIPSYFYLKLDGADMGLEHHAFIAAPKNGKIVFITRSFQEPAKVYELSQDDFLKIVRTWITIPPCLINRGTLLNSLVHF